VSQRAQGPATILLVEDEKSVRAVAARTLEGAGFTVIEAENGEQALELARHHRGSIDLVVSDVVMAKLGGPGLATRIAGDRPGIRILLVSGYSGKQMPSAGDAFLQKPFTPTDLLDKVSRLLTSQTTSGASTAVVSDSRQDSTRT
jgi:CheY-like chemotaxis protein